MPYIFKPTVHKVYRAVKKQIKSGKNESVWFSFMNPKKVINKLNLHFPNYEFRFYTTFSTTVIEYEQKRI